MADNRMWLIHKPSKIGIRLGKRIGYGWHAAPDKSELERFYKYIAETYGDQDDFILAMEDCSNSDCFDNWEYTSERIEGFHLFRFNVK